MNSGAWFCLLPLAAIVAIYLGLFLWMHRTVA